MGAGIRRVLLLCALALAASTSAGAPAPAAAQEKSFRIVAFVVDATLNPDASMDVVEHITFDFDGSFSNGTRPIPDGDYEIVEMRASENGVPLPSTGPPSQFAWRYSARDEQRTFDISYRVLRAAKVGPDVAELYWQWLGRDHTGADVVRATLRVPTGAGEVKAWGHGPLSGSVRVADPVLSWEAHGVGAATFIEGRVAVPASRFSVPPSGGPRLPAILEQETRLADEANRIRRDEAARRDRINRWFALVPILGWVVFFLIWREWGREHHTADDDVGDYVREPLDDPPAVATALLEWGEVRPVAFSATVVDLAQRGALTITEEKTDRFLLPDKTDWRFTQKGTPEGELLGYEAKVLDRLFDGRSEVTQSDLVEWAKDHASEARRWWEGWVKQVKSELKRRHYMEGGRALPFVVNVGTAVLVGVLSMVALTAGAWIGVVGFVSAFVQGFATLALRRRTREGHRRAAEWRAFRKFLQDFSQLDDAPVGHLILWERYLVYSVALGVSDEVAEALRMRVPAEQQSHVGTWYAGSSGPGSFAGLGSFGSGFGSTVASAFAPSQSSSGSGGGGGFSGGGGGGGGGGGVGAS